jgi:hypothetical protein
MPPKPKKQQKPTTCWFHAAMNGFLLSDRGEKFLKYVFENEKVQLPLTSSCPTKTLNNRKQALSLLRLYSQEGVRNDQTNVNAFVNRKINVLSQGGDTPIQSTIYNNLFKNYKSLLKLQYFSNRWKHSLYNFGNKRIDFRNTLNGIQNAYKNEKFVLSHSIILCSALDSSGTYIIKGHAMCGAHDKNGYFIFDSGYGKRIDINWTTKEGIPQIENYLRSSFPSTFKEGVDIVTSMLITWINMEPKPEQLPKHVVPSHINSKNLTTKTTDNLRNIARINTKKYNDNTKTRAREILKQMIKNGKLNNRLRVYMPRPGLNNRNLKNFILLRELEILKRSKNLPPLNKVPVLSHPLNKKVPVLSLLNKNKKVPVLSPLNKNKVVVSHPLNKNKVVVSPPPTKVSNPFVRFYRRFFKEKLTRENVNRYLNSTTTTARGANRTMLNILKNHPNKVYTTKIFKYLESKLSGSR